MPGRRPGPLCDTGATIDAGTSCRANTPRPGATAPASDAKPAPKAEVALLSFARLWAAYPSDAPYVDAKGQVPKGYDNQCAIKVCAALWGCGVSLASFKGATVSVGGKRHAIRAQELAAWLRSSGPKPLRGQMSEVTGTDWQDRIQGRTGIAYFENYWLREGETKPTGDHIDLWNGSRLTASGFSGAVVSALRFGLGIQSGPGFSDLGKSTKIVFWELA